METKFRYILLLKQFAFKCHKKNSVEQFEPRVRQRMTQVLASLSAPFSLTGHFAPHPRLSPLCLSPQHLINKIYIHQESPRLGGNPSGRVCVNRAKRQIYTASNILIWIILFLTYFLFEAASLIFLLIFFIERAASYFFSRFVMALAASCDLKK